MPYYAVIDDRTQEPKLMMRGKKDMSKEQYIEFPEEYTRRELNARYREIPLKDTTSRLLRKYFNAMLASGLLRAEGMQALFQVNNGLKCRNFWMLLQRNTIALTERPTHCWQDWCIVLTAADD